MDEILEIIKFYNHGYRKWDWRLLVEYKLSKQEY